MALTIGTQLGSHDINAQQWLMVEVDRNPVVLPRNLRPMRLSRRLEPFDSDDYIFELLCG